MGGRHLSASLLLDAGFSVASVADRMGHTTPATTLKVYGHSLQNRDKYAADEIDLLFDIKNLMWHLYIPRQLFIP